MTPLVIIKPAAIVVVKGIILAFDGRLLGRSSFAICHDNTLLNIDNLKKYVVAPVKK